MGLGVTCCGYSWNEDNGGQTPMWLQEVFEVARPRRIRHCILLHILALLTRKAMPPPIGLQTPTPEPKSNFNYLSMTRLAIPAAFEYWPQAYRILQIAQLWRARFRHSAWVCGSDTPLLSLVKDRSRRPPQASGRRASSSSLIASPSSRSAPRRQRLYGGHYTAG